jgi:fused signal recognition particle receptor
MNIQFLFLVVILVLVGVIAGLIFFKFRSDRLKKDELKKDELKKDTSIITADKMASEPVEEEKELTSLDVALANTRKSLWGRISSLFNGGELQGIDEIEEILYTSDLGPQAVEKLLESVRSVLKNNQKTDSNSVREALKEEMLSILNQSQLAQGQTLFEDFKFAQPSPSVWMIVGVNGAGKTTTIGKMAAHLAQSGKKVLVAAGDTFRAAAGSQLRVWTERAQVEIFSPEGVSDPSAVAFDAVTMGKARGFDVIIVDTAGRLHTQQNLMEELKKMKRVVQKALPEAPHEILLVLDSNQGQNALQQAKEYHKALQVTGVVLTKLDGSAKGGVAIGLSWEIKIPIKLIGVGEKIGDLRPFSSKEFVDSLF